MSLCVSIDALEAVQLKLSEPLPDGAMGWCVGVEEGLVHASFFSHSMAHQGKLFLCLASIALANELLDGSTSVCHPPLLQVPVRRFGGERHGNQEQAREYPLEGEGDLVRHGTRGCLEPLGYSGCDKLAQDPAEVVPGGEDGAKLHRCHLGGICRADDLEDAPGMPRKRKPAMSEVTFLAK